LGHRSAPGLCRERLRSDAELGEEFVGVCSWLVLLNSRSLLPARSFEGATLCDELVRAAGRC